MQIRPAFQFQAVNSGPSAQSTSSAAAIDYVVTDCSTT